MAFGLGPTKTRNTGKQDWNKYNKRSGKKPATSSNSKNKRGGLGATFQREQEQGKYGRRVSNKPSVVSEQQKADSKLNDLGFNPRLVNNKQHLSFMELGKFRRDKNLDDLLKNNLPNNDSYKFHFHSFDERYVGEGNPVADFMHARKFGELNAHTQEKLSFWQNRNIGLVADPEKAARDLEESYNEILTPEHQKASEMFKKWLNQEFNYGVGDKELLDWEKEAYYDVKDKDGNVIDRKLRLGAPPPPVGNDKDGNPVDKDLFAKNWRLQMAMADADERYKQRMEEEDKQKRAMTADYNDTSKNTTNSIADTVVDQVTGKQDIFSGLFEYHRDYIWKPLKEGEFGILANNVLVNLGETLDLTAKGFKGFLYGTEGIYGQKSGMTQTDKNQWVSSVGKKKQQKLIDLGALDAINGKGGTRVGGALGGDVYSNKKEVERKIKKEGLWKDYQRFKDEYQKYKEGDTSAGSIKSFVKAYKTKEHYDVDTGHWATDLLLETVSDPTLLLSGFAGAGRSAVKGSVSKSVRGSLEEAAETVFKGLDEASNPLLKKSDVINKYTKEYSKRFSESILGKSSATVKQEVDGLKNTLLRQGVFKGGEEEANVFGKALEMSINSETDRLSFKMLRSLEQVDNIVDQIDRTLLKGVFGVPYLSFKLGKKPITKIRRFSKEGRSIARKGTSRLYRACSNEVTGKLDLFSYNKVQEAKLGEAVAQDINVSRVLDQEMVMTTEAWLMDINKLRKRGGLSGREDELYKSVDNRISKLSGGKVNTYDEFVEYVDNLAIGDPVIDELRNKVHTQKTLLDHSVNKGKFRKDVNTLDFLTSQLDESGVLFRQNVDEVWGDIADDSLKRELGKVYDESVRFEDSIELEDFLSEELKRIKDDYVLSKPFYSKKLTSDTFDIKVDSSKYAVDREAKMPVFEDVSTDVGVKSKDFFTNLGVQRKFYYDSSFKELNSFLDTTAQEGFQKIDKIKKVEMLDWLKEGIRDLERKELIKKSIGQSRALHDNSEALLDSAKQLYNALLEEKEASLIVNAEKDMLELQEDIAHKAFRFFENNKVYDTLLSMHSSDRLFGKYLTNLRHSFIPLIKEVQGVKNLDEASKQAVGEIASIAFLVNDVATMGEKCGYFQDFMEKLIQNDVGLSSEKQLAIVETLFGRHSQSVDGFRNTTSGFQNNTIDKINTHLTALYGEDRVSLDSFRGQITDFDGTLYQNLRKRFGDEIDSVEIQERIKSICEGGHLDPTDDVKVTILQSIVRDENFILEMNEYSKVQPVWVTDIETLGLNPDKADITSISVRPWETNKINENSSFSDILDFIEDKSSMKKYHTYLDESYIDNNITPDVLDGIYKNNPRLKYYTEQLEDFKKYYSVQANNGKIVSEKNILEEFIKDLDNEANSMHDAVPKLVVHNANGFDLDFIFNRLRSNEYQIYPSHITSLDVLKEHSYNTLEKQVGYQGDIRLTNRQEEFVREILSEYACKLPDGANMGAINIKDYSSKIKAIIGKLEEVQTVKTVKNRGSKRLSELPNDAKMMDDMLHDADLLKELKEINEALDDQIYEMYSEADMGYRFLKDMHDINKFDGYQQNSIMKELNADVDSELLQIGYKNVYEAQKVMRCFEVVGRELDVFTLKQMGEFTQNVVKDANVRIKRNPHIQHTVEDNIKIINFAKNLGARLDISDELGYFRYLVVPENISEQYALAKILYDKFTSYYDESVYNDVLGRSVNYNQLSFKEKMVMHDMDKFGISFSEVREALDNVRYYSDQTYLHDIFKDEPMSITVKYNSVTTDSVEDYLRLEENIRHQVETTNNVVQASIGNESITNLHSARVMAQNQIQGEAADLFKRIANADSSTREAVKNMASDIYKYQKKMQDLQILSFINKSEDNLIAHLLYHNQILVVPSKGADEHIFEFNQLYDLVRNYEGDKLCWEIKNGDLIIGIDKKWENKLQIDKDARSIREETEMYFDNESKVYYRPQYKALGVPSEDFWKSYGLLDSGFDDKLLEDTFNYILKYEQHVDQLTGGNSIGSTGFLHDMSTQKQIYANLSTNFKNKILSVDYTTNDRFFHTPSMQMSLLGDADNCWHIGKVNVEETDVLFGRYDTLERLTQRATDEMLFIDQYFTNKSNLSLNNLFREALDNGSLSEADLVRQLKDNDDCVVYAMFEANTDTGYRIEQIEINNVNDLRYAMNMNSHISDYASYYDMYEVLNITTSNNTFFKWWSRMANMHKVLCLMKPMTWVRNILDAYQKGIIDTGTPGTYTANLVKSVSLLRQYDKLNKVIEIERGLNHATPLDLERNWEALSGTLGGKLGGMDYKTYMELDGWLSAGRSGGGSRQLLEIEKKIKQGHDWKDLTKSSTSGRDIIASDIDKFKMFSSDRAGKFYDALSDAEKQIMDRDMFLQLHNGVPGVMTDTNLVQYNYLVQSIVRDFKADKLTWEGFKEGCSRTYDAFNEKALIGMSAPERVLRLAQYLTLADKGYSEGAIHKHVVQTQFDTSVKSTGEKIMETIVPFYSFTKANLTHWAKLLNSQPTAYRLLEHIYSQLSWDWDHIDPYDYEQMQNWTQGNINPEVLNETLGKVMDVNFDGWFKLNPSFMDAMNVALAPTTKVNEQGIPPLKVALGWGAYRTGSDLFHIFGSDFEEQYASQSTRDKILNALPGVSVIKNNAYNWSKWDLSDGFDFNGLKITKKQLMRDSWDQFQKKLEEQGKFYDKNTGRVYSIEYANELGMNASVDGFNEYAYQRFLVEGQIWDANQQKFVNPLYVRPGGLNKDWDFSVEGEWEKFCKEYKKYHGKVWDNNQAKFVLPKDVIPGKLNQKGLSFQEVCKYREELFDELWDANQNAFVKRDNYIKGGLNDKNLSWGELAAFKYYLHGEEWDRDSHSWVKTTKPKFEIENYLYDNRYYEVINFVDKLKNNGGQSHDISFLEHFVDRTYANSEKKANKTLFDNIIDYAAKHYALAKTMDFSRLTGNATNDKAIFDWIKAQAQNFERSGKSSWRNYGRRWNNYSGRAGRYNFVKQTKIPGTSSFVKTYNSKAYKKYSDPFSFDNNNAGLRMATLARADYDTYYNYNYQKLYNKKGVGDLLAHHPKTNETMQAYGNRANNAYQPTTYYQGLYSASRFNGLSNTVKRAMRSEMKMIAYKR